MKNNSIYQSAKAEIIYLEQTDVITTSPTFESTIPEGEWDKEM